MEDAADLRAKLKARERGYAIIAVERAQALRHRTPQQDIRDFATLMDFARSLPPAPIDARAEREEREWRQRWRRVALRGV